MEPDFHCFRTKTGWLVNSTPFVPRSTPPHPLPVRCRGTGLERWLKSTKPLLKIPFCLLKNLVGLGFSAHRQTSANPSNGFRHWLTGWLAVRQSSVLRSRNGNATKCESERQNRLARAEALDRSTRRQQRRCCRRRLQNIVVSPWDQECHLR